MAVDREILEASLPGYDIGDELGRGGWGVVMHGRHRKLGREVAIKLLPGVFGADPTVRDRFLAEARTVAALDHPHLVPLFDYVEHDGACVIVMELLSGGTLWDRMTSGGVPADEAIAVALAALVGLEHAHAHGIMHRDLKPENLLFSSRGILKIADFGIAKQVADPAKPLTVAGSIIGTPAYMAPEQADGREIGPATDVYSMATVLYQMLTGTLPVPATGDVIAQLVAKTTTDPTPLAAVVPGWAGPIDVALTAALRRDPAQRTPTAMAFANELATAATEVLGPGWLQRCPITVLGAGRVVAITERSTPTLTDATTTGSAAPAAAPATLGPAGEAPTAAAAPAAPATGATSGAAASAAAPLAAAPPAAPPGEPRRRGRRTLVIAAAAVVLAAAAALGVFVVAGGGTDDADDTAAAAPTPAPTAAEPDVDPVDPVVSAAFDTAERDRFLEACAEGDVDDGLCTCAADAIADLPASDIRAGMDALPGLTPAFRAVFDECLQSSP